MSDSKKNNAFSSYTNGNMKLKNITSDMWEPITTSGNYTAYTPPKEKEARPKEKGSAQRGQAPQRSKSAQKSTSSQNKSGKRTNTASSNKKRSTQNSAQQHESTQRRPISTMSPPPKNIKSNKKRKKQSPKKAKPISKRSLIRRSKQCEKSNKAFARLIKSGKTTDEARKIIYLRKLRKRRLKNAGSIMFLFVFAFIFVLTYSYYEGARADTIVVSGDEVYSREEILQAAKLTEGVNMLTVRENKVNESVTKDLPFVSTIKLDYDLPDTLKLNVISTTERLIIKNGSKYICVDKTGKVVSEKKKKLSEGTFLVQGMKTQQCTVGEMFTPTTENEERFRIVLLLAQAAENNETVTYGIINVEDIKNITLTYNSKLRIYLGDGNNLTSKLAQAEKVIAESNAKDKVGYVNVKYDIGAYYMQGTMDCD